MAIHTEIAVHTETTVCRDGLLHGDMTVDTPLTVYTHVTETWPSTHKDGRPRYVCMNLRNTVSPPHFRLSSSTVLRGSLRFCAVLCGSVWPIPAFFCLIASNLDITLNGFCLDSQHIYTSGLTYLQRTREPNERTGGTGERPESTSGPRGASATERGGISEKTRERHERTGGNSERPYMTPGHW